MDGWAFIPCLLNNSYILFVCRSLKSGFFGSGCLSSLFVFVFLGLASKASNCALASFLAFRSSVRRSPTLLIAPLRAEAPVAAYQRLQNCYVTTATPIFLTLRASHANNPPLPPPGLLGARG